MPLPALAVFLHTFKERTMICESSVLMPLPALAVFLHTMQLHQGSAAAERLNAVAGISCFPTTRATVIVKGVSLKS